MSYAALIERKAQADQNSGFDPLWLPDSLYDFQHSLTEWAIRKGRAALFEDCGMGKTIQQLVWAQNVVQQTNRPVLLLTPLAVGRQTIAEAEKFGIDAVKSEAVSKPRIYVANYERISHYSPSEFAGIVGDESSSIKAFAGQRRKDVTRFMNKLQYRLLCTATAAPNDHTELGTSSEALGELGLQDMLTKFFKNEQNTGAAAKNSSNFGVLVKWRLKGHAHDAFWRWVCSWARALRMPSDLGFDDSRFVLPPLKHFEHIIKARTKAPGMLFDLPANGLKEQREEARRTIVERCEMAAKIADQKKQVLLWCHLNKEGDTLAEMIPDSVQISGADSIEKKEEALIGFATGQIRALVTKPKIGAFGLNLQNCSEMVFFPSHSFEQYYQGIRRCWRFGQKKTVNVHIVATEGGMGVLKNIKRKADLADQMFSRLVEHMNNALGIKQKNEFTKRMERPEW